eukprot:354461-Chlamydomonas_euryale.AAC.11
MSAAASSGLCPVSRPTKPSPSTPGTPHTQHSAHLKHQRRDERHRLLGAKPSQQTRKDHLRCHKLVLRGHTSVGNLARCRLACHRRDDVGHLRLTCAPQGWSTGDY